MGDRFVRRTAITRLSVDESQGKLLEATIEEYIRGCQLAADIAWPNTSQKTTVQSLSYDTIREETALSSQHAILAAHQAADAVTGCREQQSDGKSVSKPSFSSPTITYDSRTMTLFENNEVSLTTIEGRIRCSLLLPRDKDGYQWRFLENDRWEVTESTLTVQNGTYYLHIGFRRPCTDVEQAAQADETTGDGTVLGIDLGVNNLAVTSTGLFVSGDELAHWQREYEHRRGSLQRCGSRWAHENMQSIGRTERTRYTILLHKAANEVLEEARANECSHIAFEDLTDIRERLPDAKWQHRWAFKKLFDYVQYKAIPYGIHVTQVPSEYSSQRCSRSDCGYTHPDNRDQSSFCCQKCGYEIHADYNAAKNIAIRYAKHLHSMHTSSGGGVPVDVPLNSGSLTVERSTTVVVAHEGARSC